MNIQRQLPKIRSFAASYGPSLLEQAIFALQNFLLTLLAAKLLPDYAFAKLVVVYATLTLSFSLSTAIVSVPLLVFTKQRFENQLASYRKATTKLALLVGIAMPFPLLFLTQLIQPKISFQDILWAGVFHAFWVLYDTKRRWAISQGSFHILAVATSVMAFTSVLGACCIGRIFPANMVSFLIVYSAGFAAGNLTLPLFSHWQLKNSGESEPVHFRDVVRGHFDFSTALIGSLVLYWLSTQGYFLLASMYLDDQQLSGARTAHAVCGLLGIFLLTFENRLTPTAARVDNESGNSATCAWSFRVFQKLSLPLLGLGILITPILYFFHQLLYRDQYAEFSILVCYFVGYQFFQGLARPFSIAAKAMNKNRIILVSYLTSSIVFLSLGAPLIWFAAAGGVGLGFVISAMALFISLLLSFLRLSRDIAAEQEAID